MKKAICLLLAVLTLTGLAACGGQEAQTMPGDTMTLEELLDAVQKDVANLPDTMATPLTQDDFAYFAFTEMPEGTQALAADAMINATAHSAVLMRTADAETAKKLAADVEANLDPRKWICVEAEKSLVTVHNCTVLMVMSSSAIVDAMTANFDALWK